MSRVREIVARVGHGYSAWRLRRRLAGPQLLRAFAKSYPRAFFVEIGANDGDQHDHLRPFILSLEWAGIMVEPVPYIFERLRANYGAYPRVALENAAISEQNGSLPFYYLVDAPASERARLPDWYDGIGSFSREKVLAHERDIPDIADRIVAADVPCLTFASLCQKHDAATVDLLVVDTEGYDAEILASIDFAATTPRLVIYEHFHLAGAARERCRARLEQAGYETMEEGFDTFCLMPGGGDALDQIWSGLEPAVPGVSVEDEQ